MTDAIWWGETVYWEKGKSYIICQTQHDIHSTLLFDMIGDLSNFDEFIACAELIREKQRMKKVSFPFVLAYLKEHTQFPYKAIRVLPNSKLPKTHVHFPSQSDYSYTLGEIEKVQICFFDKTLLIQPFRIVDKRPFKGNFTI